MHASGRRPQAVELPIVFTPGSLSERLDTNLLYLPKELYSIMYDADLATLAQPLEGNRIAFFFVSSLTVPGENTAYVYVVSPASTETEAVFGANLVFNRETRALGIQAARAVRYEIRESYSYPPDAPGPLGRPPGPEEEDEDSQRARYEAQFARFTEEYARGLE